MMSLLLYGLLAANTPVQSASSKEVALRSVSSCASVHGRLRLRNDGTHLRVVLVDVAADDLRENCPTYHVTGFRIGILQGRDAHFQSGTWSSVVELDTVLHQGGAVHFPPVEVSIDRSGRPSLSAATITFEMQSECEAGAACNGLTDSESFNLP